MSREFTLKHHDFPFSISKNCFASSIGTISQFFSPHRYLNARQLERILPKTTNGYLANLIEILESKGEHILPLEIIGVPHNHKSLFEAIRTILWGGAFCELTVMGTPWIEHVLKDEDPDPDNSLHSIVVYGFYQPNEKRNAGYLYIYDHWKDKKRFLPSTNIYHTIPRGGFIEVNVFNLCTDPTKLVERCDQKRKYINPNTQAKILRNLPNAGTHKSSLSSLFEN